MRGRDFYRIGIFVIILLFFATGFFIYNKMPDSMAVHWNASGEPDSWMHKSWGLFIMPVVSVFMLALFLILPAIDPLKKNVEKFRKYFDFFILVVLSFFYYIYILMCAWNIGKSFDMTVMIAPAVAAVLYATGILTEKAKRNWYIGVRTPWTLSDDRVWDRTSRIGGKLFKVCAAIALLAAVIKNYAIWLMIAPVVLSVLFIVAYSYWAYRKLHH